MCKTIAKTHYFAIINVQIDSLYLDNNDAIAVRHKFHKEDEHARLH